MQMSCAVTEVQRLCFHQMASKIFHYLYTNTCVQNSKLLAFLCDNYGRFVSDLVENPQRPFSRVAAHMSSSFHSGVEIIEMCTLRKIDPPNVRTYGNFVGKVIQKSGTL